MLKVIEIDSMLAKMKNNNELLELIQKVCQMYFKLEACSFLAGLLMLLLIIETPRRVPAYLPVDLYGLWVWVVGGASVKPGVSRRTELHGEIVLCCQIDLAQEYCRYTLKYLVFISYLIVIHSKLLYFLFFCLSIRVCLSFK